jgi:hypothetical protein
MVSLLAPGMDRHKLAREVTDHLRALRGYAMSFSGYHPQAGGFWLSAAYWANLGIFILKGDRGSQSSNQTAVDLLVRAFTSGVCAPPLRGMCDPKNYSSRQVFLNAAALPKVTSGPSLFASSGVSQKPAAGYVQVTVAEYLPVSRSAATAGASSPPVPSPPPVGRSRPARSTSSPKPAAPRAIGSRCDICGELVMERALLTSTYIGCRCG